MKKSHLLNLVIAFFIFTSCAQDQGPKIQDEQNPKYIYETVVDGIDIPWGMTFISENEMLVSEKSGILYHVLNGEKSEISGLPEIYVRGQGGLLDVIITRTCCKKYSF